MFARARSLLSRRTDQSKRLLEDVSKIAGRSDEVRWLEGRIALREGHLQDAFDALLPVQSIWPSDPLTLWELAIVSSSLSKDAIALEAYERLLQLGRLEPRERVAVQLELAVVSSRGSREKRETARWLVERLPSTILDPDSEPWVHAVIHYLNVLDGRVDAVLDGKSRKYLLFYARSQKGTRESYGLRVSPERWLHLPANEQFAVLALAIASADATLAARFWASMDVTETSTLGRLRHQFQAAQFKGGNGVIPPARASFAPSPS